MGRIVSSGCLVRSQVDLYFPAGSSSRFTGAPASSVSATVFANNVLLAWPVADGSLVLDSSISSGTVYFNEIPQAPGFYSVRFFPDRVGFWRIVIRSDALGAESILEFDVVAPAKPDGGLNASFVG